MQASGEKNNEGLCVIFGEALKRNTEVVKEKEQQEVIHQHMLCRLQTMEALHHQMLYKLHITAKNNEGLHVMFNEALRRNTEMLKDKEQMEATRKEIQGKLQDMEAIQQKLQSKLQVTEKNNECLHVMFD